MPSCQLRFITRSTKRVPSCQLRFITRSAKSVPSCQLRFITRSTKSVPSCRLRFITRSTKSVPSCQLRFITRSTKSVPSCQLRFITRSTRRLRNIFHFKDVLPNVLRSYVVYRFKGMDCNALYYGKSNRHFYHRACEHLGVSHVTGKRYKTSKSSAVFVHLL